MDDVPYYYHKETDCLSWDKPECLLTEAEKAEGRRQWVWVADDLEGWIPVCVVRDDQWVDCRNLLRALQSLDAAKTARLSLPNKMEALYSGPLCVNCPMMWFFSKIATSLRFSTQFGRFYFRSSTFRKRYMEDKIYTWVGSNKTILLSINPFKSLPLYSPEQIALHANPPPNRLLPPHVYDIAYSAFQEMSIDGTDQSILISGESGAGKTEATKQCLGFIAEV